MTSSERHRLGLVWESETVERDGVRYVVRVVQRGTRLKSTGFSSLPDELALVVIVVLLPLRLLALLVTGQRFKVGVVRTVGHNDEKVTFKERVRGEDAARARASELFDDLDSVLEQ